MLRTGEPPHCEGHEGNKGPVSVDHEEGCHQHGDEEYEAKAEEEHGSNGSADSTTEGHQ